MAARKGVKRTPFAMCSGRRAECFAYDHGICRVLNDTDFKGRDCPFFKTEEDYDEDTVRADIRAYKKLYGRDNAT